MNCKMINSEQFTCGNNTQIQVEWIDGSILPMCKKCIGDEIDNYTIRKIILNKTDSYQLEFDNNANAPDLRDAAQFQHCTSGQVLSLF